MIDDASGAPKVVVFPHHDLAFRAHVEWAVEQFAPSGPAHLEASLADAYPGARVRERVALAEVGGHHAWYVYRDGSVRRDGHEDSWTKPDVAEFRIDGAGTYTAANAAAAELVGRDLDEIVGIRIGSLTRHEELDDPGLRAFEVLAATGHLESTAIVIRPGGKEVPVRYRITGTAAEGYRMQMMEREDRQAGTGAEA